MKPLITILMLTFFGSSAHATMPRLELELEGGLLFQTRNEVQIPNEATATRIDLTETIGRGPLPAGRLYATWNFNRRHRVRALFAPLEVTRTTTIDEPVRYDRIDFLAGRETEFTYKFNSYRLGYHYRVWDADSLSVFVGLTAKIRDAKVRVKQDDLRGELTDLGFVPLLYLAVDWRFARNLRLLFDFNGLAGGPGRAFDVALKVAWEVSPAWQIAAGYRTVEGGADVESVYNFAWLHYAVAAVTWRY